MNNRVFTRRVDAIAYYTEKTGLQPAKSWTIRQMVDNADNGKVSRRAKGQAVAQYVAKMGFQPAKSWTANKILAAIQTSTLPKGKAGSGDTVAELRAYCKANGLRGYSRMLKAELFALVSDHKAGIIGKEAA